MVACIELYRCRGHPNVQLVHDTTLELTSEDRLTPRGDCIACVSCRGEGKCLSRKGLGKLFIAALGLEEPHYAGIVVDGIAPGAARVERMVARKSRHGGDTILAEASRAASDAGRPLRKLLASSFTRCYALFVVLDINPEDVLTGRVVEDTGDPSQGSSN